jgi:hypothetical protein
MKNIFSFGNFLAYQIHPYLDGLNPTQSLKAKKKKKNKMHSQICKKEDQKVFSLEFC